MQWVKWVRFLSYTRRCVEEWTPPSGVVEESPLLVMVREKTKGLSFRWVLQNE